MNGWCVQNPHRTPREPTTCRIIVQYHIVDLIRNGLRVRLLLQSPKLLSSPTMKPHGGAFGVLFVTRISNFIFHSSSLIIPQCLALKMLSESSGFATDANVSRIADSHISAIPPALVPSLRFATSHCGKRFPFHIASLWATYRTSSWGDCRKVSINHWELHVQNAPSQSNLYSTWAYYAKLNVTWNLLKHLTAAREQSLDDPLYWRDIKRIHFLCKRLV